MHPARALAIPLVLAGLIAGGAALASAGAPPARGANAAGAKAVFNSPCGFSHRAGDDPIVAPGRPGASHSHDFFGNTATNAHSTAAGLRRTGTTCRRRADRAAYWVPTLLLDGRPVTPLGAQIYYRAGRKDPATVRAFPPGLRVVAGNGRASGPQPLRVTGWHCGPRGGVALRGEVPTCPPGTRLVLRVRFPDCWDGRNLDSADHQSHMAYAARRRCPGSHPVAVPRLAVNVRYPIAGGAGVSLASGSAYTAHADFLNAWNQRRLRALVRRCINARGHTGRPPCKAGRRLGRARTL